MKSKILDGIERILVRASKHVVSFLDDDSKVIVKARSKVRSAPCPNRQRWSNRRHGSYVRSLAERPSLDPGLLSSTMVDYSRRRSGRLA